MNILFTADIHVNKKRLHDAINFFELCKKIIKDEKIDLFVVGGDLWNAMIPNTKGSGFVDIVQQLKDIKELCNVSIIYGTPSHEPNGCLDFATTFGIDVFKEATLKHYEDGDLLYIPEPRRSDFVREDPTATSEAINNYLTDTCFNNTPDVIFYHGEIDNACMDNGRPCMSDYKLSQAMISLSGAKLVLAGHIHTPQSPLDNVYYVGSPVPCNYGETHEGSVITFTLKDKCISNFKRIPTNAPTYKTIDLKDEDDLKHAYHMHLENSHVKFNLPLSNGKKLAFNTNKVSQELKEATKAVSVSIKIFTEKEVSVRSKEIAKAISISEKLKIFGEINNITITPSILEKAKTLEDSLLINYNFPSKGYELISVDLRGAKGIKGKEDIFVDFSKYEDGLVALIGENGCGKTTLLEMASPFPCLLTRGGALKNHFYLKDSHKIVVFKDEKGKYYKFTIQLAADTASGLVKYFVATSDDNETWKPVKECTGNLDDYKAYVESLFGNIDLYLRTAFFTKGKTKGVPDIASATKGERISLLSQLLGTESLISLHDMAKQKMKDIKTTMASLEGIDEQYSEYELILKEYSAKQASVAKELKDVDSQLDKLQEKLPKLQKEAAKFNARYVDSTPQQVMQDCLDRVAGYEQLIISLTEHKEKNDYYTLHEDDIKDYISLNKDVVELRDLVGVRDKEYQEASANLQEVSLKVNNLEYDKKLLSERTGGLQERLDAMVDKLTLNLDVCPTCGGKLPVKVRKQLLEEKMKYEEEAESIKKVLEKNKEELKEVRHNLKIAGNAKDKANATCSDLNDKLNKLKEQLKASELTLAMNEEYVSYVDYIPVDSSKLLSQLEDANRSLGYAQDTLKSLQCEEYVDLNKDLEEAQASFNELSQEKVKISMDMASIETRLKMTNASMDKLKSQKLELDDLSHEFDEFAILEKAFSNSGIQALELESAAPSIADLTNQILRESYGDKFTVSFSTLRSGRSKLVDDFSIDITNNETGWTTPIELLSEGEKIWIIQSLYYAFSLIRMEKTGFNFKVRFVDESDGALDSEMRLKYVNMIESAHKAGNARLTIMITHSQEVKDIVSQVISLS